MHEYRRRVHPDFPGLPQLYQRHGDPACGYICQRTAGRVYGGTLGAGLKDPEPAYFFSLLIPDLSHEEKQLLDEALVLTYGEKGITHDNHSLADPGHPEHYREMPILGDFYEVLLRKQECRRMANILNRLVHGSASTFN